MFVFLCPYRMSKVVSGTRWWCVQLSLGASRIVGLQIWVDWGSVLTGFLPTFPSQIWVSDGTFVTFFGDKKCDVSHLSHFWEECDALAHENIFWTSDFFCHILPEKRHILAPPVQNIFEREEMWRFGLDWKMHFSSCLRFLTYLGSVKREGHLG